MKNHTLRVAVAAAGATGLLWVLCSLVFLYQPEMMIRLTGHMLHADLSSISFNLSWTGFFVGLLGWMVTAAAVALTSIGLYSLLIPTSR